MSQNANNTAPGSTETGPVAETTENPYLAAMQQVPDNESPEKTWREYMGKTHGLLPLSTELAHSTVVIDAERASKSGRAVLHSVQ